MTIPPESLYPPQGDQTLPPAPALPSLPSQDELEAFLALAEAAADRDTARRMALVAETIRPKRRK